jgi:hypothetical protein
MRPAMAENRPSEAADLYRRQRAKNLFMAGALVVMAVVFFALTIVRMGGQMAAHQ